MTTSYADRARSLIYESERRERTSLLNSPHMRPLTELVNLIRKERRLVNEVPNFDPCDGGIAASVLLLLEAPGPKAIKSGFISRNTDDSSAEKMLFLLKKAELKRQDTVLWNIVPWYLGTGTKIRAANQEDLLEGIIYLQKLILILKDIRAIVLVGKKAQAGFALNPENVNARIFCSSHPSPSNINSRPDAEKGILTVFKEVAEYINSSYVSTPD